MTLLQSCVLQVWFEGGEEAGAEAPDRGFGMIGAAGGAVPAMADAE